MIERIHELPFAWVLLFFWCGAMARSNAMYWAGRCLGAGASRSRWARILRSPAYASAQEWAARWGVWAVLLSFLTIGAQSLVQISAGVAHVPVPRYLLATAVGALLWAGIYTTIGIAVLAGWMASPTGRLMTAVALVAVATAILLRRRGPGRRAPARSEPGPTPQGGPAHRDRRGERDARAHPPPSHDMSAATSDLPPASRLP
ncbi:VTT domain-containing protein [Actinomyces timonensis]|uniref:VTT domain-containing protein n=1 Tax=Actinomyces timonensis TaxID=1288391 RepID=A0AAU8N495_9ACTO